MKSIEYNDIIYALLYKPTTLLAVSISGGKDSQAMMSAVGREYAENQWGADVIFIHAHLGRAEWGETMPHIDKLVASPAFSGTPLTVVKREKGDLVDRWTERMKQLKGQNKPFWSSAKARYCTSDMKRGPINKELRKYDVVISAEGIRAQESRSRASKPIVSLRQEISSTMYQSMYDNIEAGKRFALNWYPLLNWKIEDVWAEYNASCEEIEYRRATYKQGDIQTALEGWAYHPAYVYGNERLSCALCVLASKNDLLNGAKHNPTHHKELIQLERESGFYFKKDFSIEHLKHPKYIGQVEWDWEKE